jgi:hypothetical protein
MTVAAAVQAPGSTTLRISLPAELLAHFEAQAFLAQLDIEDYISAHLARTRDYLSAEPIYLDDTHAREIRRLLGGRVNTATKLLAMVERLTRMKVAGQQIGISPARQEAMVWWAKSMQLSLKEALPQLYDQALGLLLKC